MLTKSNPDDIRSFLSDASHMLDGRAEQVVFPQNSDEVADILRSASESKTPVTVSGAGTGTVGGRIPFEGIVLATDKLNQIKSIVHSDTGGSAVVECGVRLSDFQRFVETEGLIYPPDPTERSCYVGGNVATNASGARTFKYGPTRDYVERLRVVLANGELIDLRRGQLHADSTGQIRIPLPSAAFIEAQLPSYQMPRTRKHAAGYFVEQGMDLIDLFIGSEGTLGVIVEAELRLLPRPEGLLSGVVFFGSQESLLAFVADARESSLRNRVSSVDGIRPFGKFLEKAMKVTRREPASPNDDCERGNKAIDARALEYFDRESLNFLRQKYPAIPDEAAGAIFFEQETSPSNEEAVMQGWLSLLEDHEALGDASWFATNEQDQAGLREFRHALPVLMNEWFARHRQRKVSTDMSVPDEGFAEMLQCYQSTLSESGLRCTIFGHIGDNHVHVNILPRSDDEGARAREIYLRFVKRAIELGGTLSAEHGIGKLKRDYLPLLYTDEHLREMAALKRAFDPSCILGRGNIFPEALLSDDGSRI